MQVKLDSGWIGGAVGTAAAAATLMWPEYAHSVGIGLFVIAALVLILGIRIEGFHIRVGRRRRMASLIGMIVFGAGFVISAGFYFWPQPKPAQAEITPPLFTPTDALPQDPDHPPIAKTERFIFPSGINKKFTIDNNTLNNKDVNSIIPDPDPNNIATSTNDRPPTALSLFIEDVKKLQNIIGVNGYYDFIISDGDTNRIFYSIIFDFMSNSRYLSVYIQDNKYALETVKQIAVDPKYLIEDLDKKIGFESKQQGESGPSASWKMPFSGRVIIYTETQFSTEQAGDLAKLFRQNNASVVLRSTDYALSVWSNIKLGIIQPVNLYEPRGSPPLIKPVLLAK